MWELDTMNFGESLIVSVLGMAVVFTVLVALALAIIIFSKFFMMLGLGVQKKVTLAPQSVSQGEELDEESYAVLMAAVCEEIKQPLNKFRIVEIKEKD